MQKIGQYDLILSHVHQYEQQHGIAELGRIYRTKFLFKHHYFAQEHKQIEFVGASHWGWGEAPNYAGEVGFLLLRLVNGCPYQASWHGHIPIERHEDGLWCLLYQVKLWEFQEVPDVIRDNCKPNTRRLDQDGKPFDTWVRFEVLESYLKDLIAELDQKPCEPFDMADVQPWLEAPKPAM